MQVKTISPEQFGRLMLGNSSIELIDVRTPVEFREIHVSGAENQPLDQLDATKFAAERNEMDRPLYVICRSGNRARQACEKLIASGLNNVINVEGGTLACEQAGLRVVRGKKAVSLERQVRIAAGLLIVLGCALGFWVHSYWIGLAAFVGAGLTFAGVTDTCGMAMILARMPWNQVYPTPSSSNAKTCAANSGKAGG